MSAFIDLTGKRFGRLVVTHRDLTRTERRGYWHGQCDCGQATKVSILSDSLRHGKTRSCGCLKRETVALNRQSPNWRPTKPVIIDFQGESLNGAAFLRKFGNGSVKLAAFHKRLKRGMTPLEAATTIIPRWRPKAA